ncbi:type VII secretion protein EccCa [Mycobacterium sp. CVI_P3]|uniref:Type VII secretion protein EccCa n=1 Tax=Mycobacterium pinniadriaticum TaxID=2994102 RepID=A0ABT3SDW7_9MYCO|nr:type VII secretion protein EccCa [Mycobacterium pinniadriaticum]MCX2931081.1 type VII secretion protein EccCa [Mycobacterium pinniadriaticum]MCX2937695.1 type VII secretion protein EccCa [Mycobacterium pinniadriaticum]
MNRPVRLAPDFPTDDLIVGAPPQPPPMSGISRFAPILGVGAMVGVGALVWGTGMAARGPTAAVLPAMMLVSALGMAMRVGSRSSGGGLDRQRIHYLAELGRLSEQLSDAAQRQRASLLWTSPAPGSLWTLAGGRRMWERVRTDSDFCHVRIGVGRQRLARRIVVPPIGPVDDVDPVTADALRRFVHCHIALDDAPLAVALCGVRMLIIEGESTDACALVRAMVCQLAVLHAPDGVAIAALVADGYRRRWEWLKWLPHNGCSARGEPMVYESIPDSVIDDETRRRHVVLIVDGVDHQSLAAPGVTVIVVGGEVDESTALRLRVDTGRLAVRCGQSTEEFAAVDGLTMAQALTCARRLARHRGPGYPAPDDQRQWRTAFAINGPVSERVWQPVTGSARLRVALGAAADGGLVDLDIKEAAAGGHGPHGLCIGATGSGKSELLRTVVAGMIARHSPDDLNLVLIDFKGGATFLGLEGLHHVAAVITNLSQESHLVARARDALGGEIHRRQKLLRRAGNAVNLDSYQRRRDADPALPVLPTLFIVVDEFAELLSQQPDFADLFTMIGRVGRSLGVHLLLASQRPDEGRLRALESLLSYRICLKMSTAAESRAVLGVADAAELPSTPGAALLRTGDGRLIRFQATYLGARVRDRAQTELPAPGVRRFTSVPSVPRDIADDTEPTAWDVIVDRFRGLGSPAHQVWLPPLAKTPELTELREVAGGELSAAIGLVDLPFEQRRVPLVVELGGAGGNVAVVGAPRSGKSSVVRTLVTALAARLDAHRIQFYCLDFGGGTLDTLRLLPHVGSVANGRETELVRRTVSHIGAVLSARESAGNADRYADVFLVVDGWPTLREEFGDLEAAVTGFAGRGLSFGVHVILTAGRWADIRPALKDRIGTRIELRLGDPVDSDIDRKRAALVPMDRPGRGITRDGDHFLIAAPAGVSGDTRGSCQAPPVRLLPEVVDQAAVVDQAGGGSKGVLLGLGDDRLEPVALDFSRQAHLVILGDRECGKTATLRALCGEIVRATTRRPALMFVIDYRRGLLGLAEARDLLGYAFSEGSLADQVPKLITLLQNRLPAADTSLEQLKARSWWTGPEIFVIVDDYDLVSATSPDALGSLLCVLPHASDIGLHLILARRGAGSARAMFEPLLAHLRESGAMFLVMSGSPEEGPLVGHHRAMPQPPGRGLLVTHGTAQLVQIGWCAP